MDLILSYASVYYAQSDLLVIKNLTVLEIEVAWQELLENW